MFVSLLFGSSEQTSRLMRQPARVVGFESQARQYGAHRRCFDYLLVEQHFGARGVRVPK
jgi:hypothetical protein